MTLCATDEQRDLKSAVRRFLAEQFPEHEIRRLMATDAGFEETDWTHFASELGVCGLGIPEQYGGAGGSFTEVAIVLEELGRTLAPLPYLSTVVLAQRLLMASDDSAACRKWLPRMSSGEVRGTVALDQGPVGLDESAVTLPAVCIEGEWRLTGTEPIVLDGHSADVILVPARTARGVSIFAVEGAARGLARTPLQAMDLTRKQACLEFDSVSAQLVGQDGAGWQAVSEMLALAAIGIAAESVGGAQVVLEAATEYAKRRVQFGYPIGAFQAIKHRCADVLVDIELARSAVVDALRVVAEGTDIGAEASLAKACASDAYWHAASQCIQVHGGIGFTFEHSAHLYFRRAKTNQIMFGDSTHHRELLAGYLGL
jgi:alkylation response protein AidB-like acyl-CoA dehydrogenase